MLEIRPIPGYPSYGASADGKIWRFLKHLAPREKTPTTMRGRYHYVSVSENGKFFNKAVHSLVAAAFLGPRPNGMQVAHNDGNGFNNAIENLRYATPKENTNDKHLHGTMMKGQDCHLALLSKGDVEWIRAYPKERGAARRMAKRLQVSPSTIERVLRGATWRHV